MLILNNYLLEVIKKVDLEEKEAIMHFKNGLRLKLLRLNLSLNYEFIIKYYYKLLFNFFFYYKINNILII